MKPLLLVTGMIAVSAAAQTQRAFVSAKIGNDANTCSLASPCRGFQRAVGVVAVGGEVIALDSGGYGRFDVSQSISVSAPPGIYAGITTTAGQFDAVHIAAAGPVSVVLRGLSITNLGGMGVGGIYFSTLGGIARIESCSIDGAAWGVFAGTGTTVVSRCVITRCFSGVEGVGASGFPATSIVDQVRVSDCNEGIVAFDYSDIDVRNCVIVKNIWGLLTNSTAADGNPQIVADGCMLSANRTGVQTASPGTALVGHIFVSNSTITDSTTTGIELTYGSVYSFGNNTVVDNAGNQVFTNTFPQK